MGELAGYKFPYYSDSVHRYNTRLGLGITFDDFRAFYTFGWSHTEYKYYSGAAANTFGLRLQYFRPLSGRWKWFAGLGWEHIKAVTLDYNTGQPTTSSALANGLCAFFSFGLADNCGNVYEHTTLPASNEYSAQLGLSFSLTEN